MQLFNYEHKKCYSNEIIEIDRSSEERPTLRDIISRELDPGFVRFDEVHLWKDIRYL